ncbi:MAG: lipid-A-disaccharide synthase [Rickettsiales bacterium]|jgi:lipid-A-disaccharide synthase|nr:lipid-A-disaccharide synthase [Rickettsiales bacterium]
MVNKKIFIIAGEASGDILGHDLMKAILSRDPSVEIAGVGGEEMSKIPGFKSLFDIRDIAVMGIVEVFKNLPTIMRRLKQTAAAIAAFKPDLLVTIDAPGFNMPVARRAKKLVPSLRAAHYVAPQVWAWKERRAAKIAALYDYLLCLFPFEPKYFEKYGLPTFVVGHTAVETARGNATRFRKRHDMAEGDLIITMLPGSRVQMARRLLPVFERTAELLSAKIPNLKIVIPTTATAHDFIRAEAAKWRTKPLIVAGKNERYDAFAASGAALSISGTAVLELALANVPTVAAYKASALTYFIGHRLVKLPSVTLPNIIAGKEVVPEFIQDKATPEALAAAIMKFLNDGKYRDRYFRQLETVRERLTPPGGKTPSAEAASIILDAIGGGK